MSRELSTQPPRALTVEVTQGMTTDGRADWERRKVGDRVAGFSVLLPARPNGAVVVAARSRVATALCRCFPDTVVLDNAASRAPGQPMLEDEVTDRVVRWDGVHSPLRPASVGMLVLDSEVADPDALRPALGPGGAHAVLGSRGRYVSYPTVEIPEQVWQRGWPLPTMPRLMPLARRFLGLRAGLRRDAPRLEIDPGCRPSLAEEILTELAAATGLPGRLVGIQTAGHTILRVRRADGDVAVRVSLTDTQRQVSVGTSVAAEVPALAPLVLTELARGTTHGRAWVATAWLPHRRRRLVDVLRAPGQQAAAVGELVAALRSQQTGVTAPGWAHGWCAAVQPLPPDVRTQFSAAMAPIERAFPTGWCHGDPWAGNIVLDRDRAAVIDWDNASADAPQGIDAVLSAALHAAAGGQESVAEACVRLAAPAQLADQTVAGRRWDEWDDATRRAFVVAAFVLYLRNRSIRDLGEDALRRELDVMLRALCAEDSSADDGDECDPLEPDRSTTGRQVSAGGQAARGALWLGASAVVVKAAQTAVLLILAALLPPSALGLVAIGTLIATVAATLSQLGTSTALVYWRGDVGRAARTAVTVALVASLLVTAAVWALAPWLADTLRAGPDGTNVIRGLISVLPCVAISAVSLELLRRELAFLRRIIPDVVGAVIGASVAVVLALQGHGVAALVIGQIIQGVLTLLLAWMVGRPVLPGWRREDFRGLLSYGGHLTGGNFAQLALVNVDYLIVARVLGGFQLGQYSLAFRLAYLPYLNVAFVISGAAFPYLCRKRGPAIGRASERVSVLACTVFVPLCVGIAVLADQMMLLGHKWAPAVPVLRWLAVYAIVLSFVQVVQTSLNAHGLTRSTMGLRLLHLAALTAVLLLLAPHGIVAVAIGQVIAVVIAGGATLVLARRALPGWRLGRVGGQLAPSALGAAVMAAAVLVLQHVLPGPTVSVTNLVLLGAAGLLAYAVPVWALDHRNLLGTARTMAGRA